MRNLLRFLRLNFVELNEIESGWVFIKKKNINFQADKITLIETVAKKK